MPFDFDVLMLHGATKEKTLEYLRDQAKAGKPISPRALAMLADILDPKSKGGLAGRPKAKPPFAALEWAGRLQALHRHGIIKLPSNDLPGFVAENLNKGVSDTTPEALRRALLNPAWRIIADYSYLKMAFFLFAKGKIKKIKLLKTNTSEQVESTITELLLEQSITIADAQNIRDAVK